MYNVLDDLKFCHVDAGFTTGLLLMEMGLTFGPQVGRSGQIDTVLYAHKARSDGGGDLYLSIR